MSSSIPGALPTPYIFSHYGIRPFHSGGQQRDAIVLEQKTGLGHQHGIRFVVLGHQYGGSFENAF